MKIGLFWSPAYLQKDVQGLILNIIGGLKLRLFDINVRASKFNRGFHLGSLFNQYSLTRVYFTIKSISDKSQAIDQKTHLFPLQKFHYLVRLAAIDDTFSSIDDD